MTQFTLIKVGLIKKVTLYSRLEVRDKDEKELSEEPEVDGQEPQVKMEVPGSW